MATVEYSGRGKDPERLLAMLWRHWKAVGDRPAAGRRPRLSVDAVVDAATALADAEDLPALSMSRVAKALGVGTMTLYTYVPSKADLIDLMVDQAFAECDFPGFEPLPAERWRDRVMRYAQRIRELYRRHPWLRAVSTVRPPVGPGMFAEHEHVLSTVGDIGLTPAQVVDTASAIGGYVHTMAGSEVESAQVEADSGESHEAWWGSRMSVWEHYFDPERHPTTARLWEAGGFDEQQCDTDVHEFGLRRLLDGIAAIVDNE